MLTHRKLIIIGSGPAGLTAAIYGSRANLQPLLIEGEPVGAGDQPGGQLMDTTEIENYPGAVGVQGPALMATMRQQAASFGTEIITKRVTKVDLSQRPFRVWVGADDYTADTVIIATGAKPLMLGLDAEWRLMGRGVSACASTRDAESGDRMATSRADGATVQIACICSREIFTASPRRRCTSPRQAPP